MPIKLRHIPPKWVGMTHFSECVYKSRWFIKNTKIAANIEKSHDYEIK